MTASSLEPVRWSRRRWCYAIGAVLVLQLALTVFLGERAAVLRPVALPRTAIHAAADPQASRQLVQSALVPDPTRLALPSADGFSGAAWLTYPAPQHRLSDWTEPPRWLALEAERLAGDFRRFVKASGPRPLLVADKTMPRLSGLEPEVARPPVRTASELRVEGELARRPLITRPALRSWTNSDLLSNTVVRLLVDAHGYPQTATLLSGSGSVEADQFALRTAAQARFAPLPRLAVRPSASRLEWGNLIFEWHTLLPADTNTLTLPP